MIALIMLALSIFTERFNHSKDSSLLLFLIAIAFNTLLDVFLIAWIIFR